ncbi:hypothetical protein [Thalassolituus hydrocarboniclasticus]|uniref:Uncharacterized protein n=1 Tax=Thalassolituus hydrocarboniclasticus TaxID=2742796 RepID=A0ABY6A8Y1_9GAMM|nr:hypothetical protein [Thalassolituus hydrocarboniclasticus]UXD87117.1 hypothetical protein HUF19_06545 [Thalassolituus hydrocarboniclasticus]
MIWLIVSVGVMAIIGSVMMLRPSPRDTRLAALRFDAIRNGLQVRSFTFKPDAAKTGIRNDIPGTSYTLLRLGKQQGGELKFRVVGQAGWDTEGLPEGLSWHNQGSAADAELISRMLPQLQDNLLMLEVYENRVTLMASENQTASAAAYQHFMEAFF